MNTLTSPQAFAQTAAKPLIVDCHGHYTTEPEALNVFRAAQIAALKDPSKKPSAADLKISDDQLRESVQPQLNFQRERGTDVTLFSPRAGGMGHHIGTAETSAEWSQVSNELIHRIASCIPIISSASGNCRNRPGVRPDNCIGGARALREDLRIRRGESQSRSVRRLLARPAAVRSLVVSAV